MRTAIHQNSYFDSDLISVLTSDEADLASPFPPLIGLTVPATGDELFAAGVPAIFGVLIDALPVVALRFSVSFAPPHAKANAATIMTIVMMIKVENVRFMSFLENSNFSFCVKARNAIRTKVYYNYRALYSFDAVCRVLTYLFARQKPYRPFGTRVALYQYSSISQTRNRTLKTGNDARQSSKDLQYKH